jgi:hypothetical protein
MSNLKDPQMHPSQFTDSNSQISNNIKGDRTLLNLTDERSLKFAVSDLTKLKSPGSYRNTGDNKITKGSNTNALFKNLYGETLLTYLFFSQENIDNIQKLLRMLVYKEMGKIIDNQSSTDLLIIMRSIFLSYSNHPELIDETMTEEKKNILLAKYQSEVSRLNELVINYTVPQICSQLQQYLQYLEDASSPVKTMEKPVSTNVAGTKTYRSITSVLTGSNL